ncbi:hypothetical protein TRFO_41161 [Tritrichomonas foetus]|uniref:Condensation domain-containing protein n=1 Tax=Tritrichomonas foetus TaxID=1144522 RepID=A0A1J4L1I1_9EUKA|nr:hypothetical protein TRFO_41161 [Tritrichomonas foetus]|eukprot:OHT17274.1 hypothetical protein TRFO_41161 [Tritrichomonas foetus]
MFEQLTQQEISFFKSKTMIQLALELSSKAEVRNAIEYFTKSVPGLHLRLKGTRVEHFTGPVKLYTIPDQYKTLQDAAFFTSTFCTPEYSESFASLGYNDSKIVLNIQHRYSDGGYFKFLVDNYGNPPSSLTKIPKSSNLVFKDEISSSPTVPQLPYDERLTRFFSHDKIPQKIEDERDQFITHFMAAKEFKNYDPVKNSPKSYSESLWLANYFAASAQENHLFPSFGISTFVDLRQFMKTKYDFGNCAHIASVTPYSIINPNMKLSDVAREMRNDLTRQLNEGYQFGHAKSTFSTKDPIPGIWLEITNMGPLKIKPPIKDAWASLTMKNLGRELTSLMTFSVIDGDRNDVVTRFRYSPHVLSRKEATRMAESINYFLRNVSFDRTVASVYDEIKSIYKQL